MYAAESPPFPLVGSIILLFISTLPLLLITFIFYVHIIFFSHTHLQRCSGSASAIHYLITAKPYNIKNDMLHICGESISQVHLGAS